MTEPQRLSVILPSVVAELARHQPEIDMTAVETPHLLPADGADQMIHVCRRCHLVVDNWTGPPSHWVEPDLCCVCSHALAGEALRAMARRVAQARRELHVETREILESQGDALREMWAERDRARHARHKPWLRGKLAGRLVHYATVLGVISGSGWSTGGPGGCNGCVTVYWRGRRSYVLGLRREQWACLRAGHRRREIPGANLCTICAPCWVCSNTEVDHDAWACEIAADKAKTDATSSSVPSRGQK